MVSVLANPVHLALPWMDDVKRAAQTKQMLSVPPTRAKDDVAGACLQINVKAVLFEKLFQRHVGTRWESI